MKKMEKFLEVAIMVAMTIMTYIGFRAFWFADNYVEVIVGIGAMLGFGAGMLIFMLKKNKLYDEES